MNVNINVKPKNHNHGKSKKRDKGYSRHNQMSDESGDLDLPPLKRKKDYKVKKLKN